jgi:hypothetical protein
VPTLVEVASGQLLLVSTAHRRDRGLIVSRRNRMLADPTGDRVCWLEWSAGPDADPADPAAWRAASPHWHTDRHDLIADAYDRAAAGEASDTPDEPDPLEAFRGQWLNRWAQHRRNTGRGEPLVPLDAWAAAAGRATDPTAIAVGINDNYGEQAAVAIAALDVDGRVEVDGRLCETRSAAFAAAAAFVRRHPKARTVIGVTLRDAVPVDYPNRHNLRVMGAQEAGRTLPAWRALFAEGRIVHTDTGDLDGQLAAARVYPLSGGGLGFANNGARVDLLKAALWAVAAAVNPPPNPQIR